MYWGSSHCSTSPPSHRRISTIYYKIFHKGNSTDELQLTTLEYTTPTLTPLHKREHKAKKEKLQPWWSNDHKQHLMISKDHKQFSHKIKILKIDFNWVAQVCEKSKCLKKNNKENTWEKLLDRYEIWRTKLKFLKLDFLWFSKTLKTNKDISKTCFKTL